VLAGGTPCELRIAPGSKGTLVLRFAPGEGLQPQEVRLSVNGPWRGGQQTQAAAFERSVPACCLVSGGATVQGAWPRQALEGDDQAVLGIH